MEDLGVKYKIQNPESSIQHAEAWVINLMSGCSLLQFGRIGAGAVILQRHILHGLNKTICFWIR